MLHSLSLVISPTLLQVELSYTMKHATEKDYLKPHFCSLLCYEKGEKNDDENRTEILFDRLMLMELRENVTRLDTKAYADLKSYK